MDLQNWAIQTAAMLLTCFLLPRLKVRGPLSAFFTVVALGFINTHYWDATLFLHLPQNLELNTAILVLINGALFWFLVKVLPGIEIEGVFPAIAAPILFSLVSSFLFNNASKLTVKEAARITQQTLRAVESATEAAKKEFQIPQGEK